MGLFARLGFKSLEQASAPSTPGSGERILYPKASGWFEKDSAGVERLLTHAIEVHTFSVTGPLVVQTGKSRVYLEGNYTVETVRASVNTQPTGAAIRVDVNKNGTTIYTTNGNRPNIAVSTNTATANSPDITTFTSGDYITVDVDIVGSTIAGSDLTVTIRLRRTS